MTREEAINHLKTVAKTAIDSGYDSAVVDAVDMAREALEQEPCGKDVNVPATDAISRQAVLNILDDMVKDYVKENDFNKAQGVAWVKVQKLPPVSSLENPNKWIPVNERLPEKNGKHNTFLVTDHDGNLSISKFYLPLLNSDIEKPYWSGMIDVIAWMPLPEPYRVESEGQA